MDINFIQQVIAVSVMLIIGYLLLIWNPKKRKHVVIDFDYDFYRPSDN